MIETQREAHIPRGTVGLGDICREQETLFSGEGVGVGEGLQHPPLHHPKESRLDYSILECLSSQLVALFCWL